MRTEHTLRYLLLRHLKGLEHQVPQERFLEVTRSLQVVVERDRFRVTWQLDGKACEEELPRQAFVFYRRGDVDAEARAESEDLRSENDAVARAFAERVFGVRTQPAETHARLEPHAEYALVECVSFALFIGFAGSLGVVGSVALLALCVAEFTRRGRLFTSLLFLPMSALGPPIAATFSASAYGALQFLDPFPAARPWRLVACAVAAAIGLWRCEVAGLFDVDLPVTLLAFLGVVTAAARSFVSTHFRALPLALPFYCVGLALDDRMAAAYGGLAILILGTGFSAYAHQWLPVQRERSLPPNG